MSYSQAKDMQKFEQVCLHYVMFAATKVLSAKEMEPPLMLNMQLRAILPAHMHNLVISLSGMLLGEKVDTRTFSYPETWIDALKQRWFPAWALKRWPPVILTHTVTTQAVYPNFKPKLDNQPYVYVLQESSHKSRGNDEVDW